MGTKMRAALLAALLLAGCDEAVGPDATVRTVEVGPTGQALGVGDTVRFAAVARTADGSVVDGAVQWSLEGAAVAELVGQGGTALLRATAPGTARVRAAVGGRVGEATVTVSTPPPPPVQVDSVMVYGIGGAPGSAQLAVLEPGWEATAGAAALTADGNQIGGLTITWRSADTTVATVTANADGSWATIRGRAPGTATILAEVAGRAGRATVIVPLPSPPTSAVAIEPDSVLLELGGEVEIRAQAWDAATGAWIEHPTVLWLSSDSSVVAATGLAAGGRVRLRGLREGTARVSAFTGGRSATALVRVKAAAGVGGVIVVPHDRGLWTGELFRFRAEVIGPTGGTLPDHPVAWSVEDTTIAEIGADGLARALRPGRTRVVARSGGVTRTAELRVLDQPVGRTVLDLLPNVEPPATPRVTVVVGHTSWTDPAGVVHPAEKRLVAGALTLDLASARWEQSLTIDVVVVHADQSQTVVGGETWLDGGEILFPLFEPWVLTLRSLARPGAAYQGTWVEAGVFSLRQAVGTAPVLDWLHVMP